MSVSTTITTNIVQRNAANEQINGYSASAVQSDGEYMTQMFTLAPDTEMDIPLGSVADVNAVFLSSDQPLVLTINGEPAPELPFTQFVLTGTTITALHVANAGVLTATLRCTLAGD